MERHLLDRFAVLDLVQGWMYRDNLDWDRLRTLFHPDGGIEVTWFKGQFTDFVNASKLLAKSEMTSKHLIGVPQVTFNKDRAIAETNVIVSLDSNKMGLGCNVQARFYDRVERRQGAWKISYRWCIYDMGSFSYPRGFVEVDLSILDKFPQAYAPLGYLLEKMGVPIKDEFPARGSDAEKIIKDSSLAWLYE